MTKAIHQMKTKKGIRIKAQRREHLEQWKKTGSTF
jgi:hypothetical protein